LNYHNSVSGAYSPDEAAAASFSIEMLSISSGFILTGQALLESHSKQLTVFIGINGRDAPDSELIMIWNQASCRADQP